MNTNIYFGCLMVGRLSRRVLQSGDLRTDFVATQAVSPEVMVSGSDQFRRTLAGGL